jgi:hypothetical protein
MTHAVGANRCERAGGVPDAVPLLSAARRQLQAGRPGTPQSIYVVPAVGGQCASAAASLSTSGLQVMILHLRCAIRQEAMTDSTAWSRLGADQLLLMPRTLRAPHPHMADAGKAKVVAATRLATTTRRLPMMPPVRSAGFSGAE